LKKVRFFALSTCGWCKKTKRFLDAQNVNYEIDYVDRLSGAERAQVIAEMERWNPRRTFPTVVVDDKEVVVGFKEDRLREVLGL
jgi:glutaredoxin-like protein NrdH